MASKRRRLNSVCIARLAGHKICFRRSILPNWKHRITSVNSRLFAENRNLSFHNPEQRYNILLILHYRLNRTDLRWLVIYNNVAFYFLKIDNVTRFPTIYLFSSENLHWWELRKYAHGTHRNHKQEDTGKHKPTIWHTASSFHWPLISYNIWSTHTAIGSPTPIKLFPPCGMQKLISLKLCISGWGVPNYECDYR